MPQPLSRKEATHAHIVKTAARIIRRSGYAGVGVADIMKEAGLTHGGFYAHFASRTALLAEASDHASAESMEHLRKVADGAPPTQALAALVESYLSDHHLSSPETGCVLAALGSEMPRQAPEVRHASTRRFMEMVDLIERQMSGWGDTGQHQKALGIVTCLVGAMVISRAVDDAALSGSVRDAARQLISLQAAS